MNIIYRLRSLLVTFFYILHHMLLYPYIKYCCIPLITCSWTLHLMLIYPPPPLPQLNTSASLHHLILYIPPPSHHILYPSTKYFWKKWTEFSQNVQHLNNWNQTMVGPPNIPVCLTKWTFQHPERSEGIRKAKINRPVCFFYILYFFFRENVHVLKKIWKLVVLETIHSSYDKQENQFSSKNLTSLKVNQKLHFFKWRETLNSSLKKQRLGYQAKRNT